MNQKNTNYIAIPSLLKVEKGALKKIGAYLETCGFKKSGNLLRKRSD